MDFSNGSGNRWGWDYMAPNEGKDYTWYISGKRTANWVIICYRSHLFPEPEKIEKSVDHLISFGHRLNKHQISTTCEQ